eukprot:994774-Rhodomonas_salina.1
MHPKVSQSGLLSQVHLIQRWSCHRFNVSCFQSALFLEHCEFATFRIGFRDPVHRHNGRLRACRTSVQIRGFGAFGYPGRGCCEWLRVVLLLVLDGTAGEW